MAYCEEKKACPHCEEGTMHLSVGLRGHIWRCTNCGATQTPTQKTTKEVQK